MRRRRRGRDSDQSAHIYFGKRNGVQQGNGENVSRLQETSAVAGLLPDGRQIVNRTNVGQM